MFNYDPGCEECVFALQRLYADRPGLVLSLAAAAAMLRVRRETCAQAMHVAVRQRLLRCNSNGEFVLRG